MDQGLAVGAPAGVGVTLSVPMGSLTALLGAAGSGKSALMRMLAGSGEGAGRVIALGEDVTRLSAHRRGFGVVQQPDVLAPRLTLAENVAVPLRARGIPRGERSLLVTEVLDQLGLDHAASLRPGQATAAERQRACLARALVFQPRVLLLDEPFSDQDQTGRMELAATLRRLHVMLGATTLLATGHAPDALAVADHIAVLYGGGLVQLDTAQAVWDRPATADVAALLGEVNRLPGRVEGLLDDTAAIRLACGPLVETAMPGNLAAGDPCVVMLRPERIAIAPVQAAEMGEGALDATLIDLRFLGEVWRLTLLIGSGAEIVVRRPASSGLRGLQPGAAVSIAWQPHHAAALPSGATRVPPVP